jgi:hypothetical protein
MEQETKNKIVSVSDINRKRSSLKNPMHSEEMKKLFENKKSQHLQFELESIKENEKEVEEVSNHLN